MNYSEAKVIQAFQLYTKLARDGFSTIEDVKMYKSDDDIRSLLDHFSREVACIIVVTSEKIYLVPQTKFSPFHVSNEWIKRNYLSTKATNADLYLLYFSSLVLFGCFYDSYQTKEATLTFLTMEKWLDEVSERMHYLRTYDVETLKKLEQEFSYNWLSIMEKWEDMNDIKETAKRQAGRTISRLSFLQQTKRFLIDQDLIKDIGNEEVELTEKAKTIVQRYFMDIEYNKGIIEFLYSFEGGNEHASD